MPPRKRIVKLVCLLLLTACVLGVGLRGAYRGRELQRRLICIENLKRLAAPSTATGTLVTRSLICPSSASSTSNYVLVPLRPSASFDNRTVVAYEPKSNHGGEGGNVVFADGHATFVRVPEYDELVSSLAEANP